ncbi:hypothetical protein HK097_009027 [Rhizophlyctis rosea]|uniref:3'-5' exonuclease domain-containing protein n=1 Tax=Rhizophlyctis rosea TaxID=64517 RepID=A0AAD5X0Q5_9FUNG|nr:hypothetical protein HK097_009027 [Rhizophlyctis rosea]
MSQQMYQQHLRVQQQQQQQQQQPRSWEFSKALDRNVKQEDAAREEVLRRLLVELPPKSGLETYRFRVELPIMAQIPGDKQPSHMQLVLTKDVEEVERWIKHMFYNEIDDGSLVGVKRTIGASGDRELVDDFMVILIQIGLMAIIPSTLTRFMADHRISKAFHGFEEDLVRLTELGIPPMSAFEVNSLSRLYLHKTQNYTLYSRFPKLTNLTKLYLDIEKDNPFKPHTAWHDERIHVWRCRYAGIDVWLLWGLVRHLSIRIKTVFGEEEGEKAMRREIGARMRKLEVGGQDLVNVDMFQ